MTDRQPFIDMILANPDADGPRLVYADWLEDEGEGERAEFIRVQVDLASDPDREKACRETCQPPDFDGCPQKALRIREEQLHAVGAKQGWNALPGATGWRFVRGFIEWAECTFAGWRAHAAAILAAQPVREVTLTTWLTMFDRIRPRKTVELLRKKWPQVKIWNLPWQNGQPIPRHEYDDYTGFEDDRYDDPLDLPDNPAAEHLDDVQDQLER